MEEISSEEDGNENLERIKKQKNNDDKDDDSIIELSDNS